MISRKTDRISVRTLALRAPSGQAGTQRLAVNPLSLESAPLVLLQDAENVQRDDDDDGDTQQPKADTFHLRSPECCCSTTMQCDLRARQPLRRRISLYMTGAA